MEIGKRGPVVRAYDRQKTKGKAAEQRSHFSPAALPLVTSSKVSARLLTGGREDRHRERDVFSGTQVMQVVPADEGPPCGSRVEVEHGSRQRLGAG